MIQETKMLLILDATLDRLAAAERAIVALRGDRDRLESELQLAREGMGEYVNALIRRANIAEGRINGLVETVASVCEALRSETKTLSHRANGMTLRVDNVVNLLATVRDEAQTTIDHTVTVLGELAGKVNRLEDDMEGNESDYDRSLDELRGDVATINYDVACLSQRIDTVDGRISDLDAELTGLL